MNWIIQFSQPFRLGQVVAASVGPFETEDQAKAWLAEAKTWPGPLPLTCEIVPMHLA